ncbi:MAG: hypothetical protein AB7F19_00595 [Candidatus Babeliales bacterium]
MKRILMAIFILLPGIVCGMEQHHERLGNKLRLILTAGRYVYNEHITVQSDARDHAAQIDLCIDYDRNKLIIDIDRQKLAGYLDEYIELLDLVSHMYHSYSPQREEDVEQELEATTQSYIKWFQALGSDHEISGRSLGAFLSAFYNKKREAAARVLNAHNAEDDFHSARELCALLPVRSAVTAWCVKLPDPEFIMADDIVSGSSEEYSFSSSE